MFSFFKKKPIHRHLTADLHSHLLPNLDDGVKSLEEALRVITHFEKAGFNKMVTTPHIMSDFYHNSPETILPALASLQEFLKMNECQVAIEGAAEYYLDENLMGQLEKGDQLLSFGSRYILFETNAISEPLNLNEFIFQLTIKGWKPVFAHPERYSYFNGNTDRLEDLRNRGVLFQINSLSFTGFYSKPVQKMARYMVDHKWVDFVGSDCHNLLQAALLEEVYTNTYYKKTLDLELLNHKL